MALTDKREAFCREYLVDFNASAAVRRAGYGTKTPNVTGSALLAMPEVAARVEELKQEVASENDLRVETVVQGLLREAKDHDIPASSRVAAWAHLGKYLGMFTEKVDQTNRFEPPEAIERIIIPLNNAKRDGEGS